MNAHQVLQLQRMPPEQQAALIHRLSLQLQHRLQGMQGMDLAQQHAPQPELGQTC